MVVAGPQAASMIAPPRSRATRTRDTLILDAFEDRGVRMTAVPADGQLDHLVQAESLRDLPSRLLVMQLLAIQTLLTRSALEAAVSTRRWGVLVGVSVGVGTLGQGACRGFGKVRPQ